MKNTTTSIQAKDLGIIAVVTGLVLLIPLVAMQFTSEVDWKLPDFLIIGTLLFGTGVVISLIIRKVTDSTQKIFLVVLALAAMLYVWAELAVGIFFNFGS